MNLTTDKWIPVVRMNGRADTVSLEQVFGEGVDIRDLAVRPHERIALMRLLLAVSQSGLDGPRDDKDWRHCRDKVADAAKQHLKDNHSAFELFGSDARFAQARQLDPASQTDDRAKEAVTKLDFALATGHNQTVFDNSAASTMPRYLSPAQAVLCLLAFQCFAPPGGSGYTGKSPCGERKMLHAFLRGGDLLETVWRNLLTKEDVAELPGCSGWGRASWLLPENWQRDSKHLSSYLGRLCPMTKGVWLQEQSHDDGSTDVAAMEIQRKGMTYSSFEKGGFREPAGTLCTDGKKRWLLAADSKRAIWRDLPAMLPRRALDRDARLAPVALQRYDGTKPVDLWVGALIVVKTAKIENSVESIFHIPATSCTDDFTAFFAGGVLFAECWATAIEAGLSSYRLALGDNIDRRQAHKRATLMRQHAASHFWTAIETAVREVLFPLAADPPDNLKCDPPYYLDYSRSESGWGPLVRRAAEDAFALACPQASARQASAYGAGRQTMLAKQPRPNLKAGAAIPEPSSNDTKEL